MAAPARSTARSPASSGSTCARTDLHSKYSLPDLAAHEAIPGHVWQGEYANKLPLIRTLLAFNAYSEGWALYAEQLVDELGVYDDFPVGRLGYLQSIAFRCCRLVVDTGLHAKRWTRQQGVDFFVQRNGSNPLEVASEVDRYCSWPGQACGYKVGHSDINRLRDKAKAELGPKYDLRAFDDAVVLGGNVPMDVLAKNVGRLYRADESRLVEDRRPASGRCVVRGRAQRSRLRPAAINAATAEAASRLGPTSTPNRWKATPTATAPVVWPKQAARSRAFRRRHPNDSEARS